MATKSKPAEITTDADDTLPEEPQHPQFAPGQKVRDIYGKGHVVVEQIGCAVYLRAGPGGSTPRSCSRRKAHGAPVVGRHPTAESCRLSEHSIPPGRNTAVFAFGGT